VAGKLAFPRTRKDPAYAASLPLYNCQEYEYREFLIEANDHEALDDISDIEDTLSAPGPGGAQYYLVRDTLYLQPNPNHYNIEVDFLVKDNTNNFVEYDWRKERCTTFDGRFPFLSEDEGAALDGTLRYTMESRGFKFLFGGKTMKLRIQITDRLLHKSNVVESGEFTLDGIRRCGS
jgi:hypothetical protein